MADVIIKIIEPADTFDLLSLDEFKLMAGIAENDTSQDEEIAAQITRFSDVVATMCARVFAKEELSETWRNLNGGKRLYLSHWPVKADDIISIESPRGTPIAPDAWEIEEESGKIELFGVQSATEPIVVTYTGGFDLPDEAPPALKQATELLMREYRALSARLGLGGIRSISHKEARVMYFDPLAAQSKTAGLGPQPQSPTALLLARYMRFPV